MWGSESTANSEDQCKTVRHAPLGEKGKKKKKPFPNVKVRSRSCIQWCLDMAVLKADRTERDKSENQPRTAGFNTIPASPTTFRDTAQLLRGIVWEQEITCEAEEAGDRKNKEKPLVTQLARGKWKQDKKCGLLSWCQITGISLLPPGSESSPMHCKKSA